MRALQGDDTAPIRVARQETERVERPKKETGGLLL